MQGRFVRCIFFLPSRALYRGCRSFKGWVKKVTRESQFGRGKVNILLLKKKTQKNADIMKARCEEDTNLKTTTTTTTTTNNK